MRTRPLYERQKALGAVFGLNFGWEHPLWFAEEAAGDKPVETYGFERQGWFTAVARECHALRSGVGLIDISNFAKYQVKGPGARDWIDRLLANTAPVKPGRSCLAPLIGIRGGIAGDFTVTCLADDHYMMFGSGMAERYHRRFFDRVPLPSGTTMQSLTDTWCGFNVAGPRSRQLLRRVTNADLGNDAFRFMSSQRIMVAGREALALRVSFSGDLGWELYVPEADQVALYDTLLEAGRDLGIKPVGGRALLSLRLEKGYGSWGREYSPEYWPHEVGLDRLVKLEKPEFLGRNAWLAVKDKPARYRLVSFRVKVDKADAVGGEPVFTTDGVPVGSISSGGYGHTVGASLAMGAIKAEHAVPGKLFEIAVLGRPHRAELLAEPLFDPRGKRLRG